MGGCPQCNARDLLPLVGYRRSFATSVALWVAIGAWRMSVHFSSGDVDAVPGDVAAAAWVALGLYVLQRALIHAPHAPNRTRHFLWTILKLALIAAVGVATTRWVFTTMAPTS